MGNNYSAEDLRGLNEEVYRVDPYAPTLNGKPASALKQNDIFQPTEKAMRWFQLSMANDRS
ncbi:MAG: hypothetical protein LBI13_07440 [Streptococcaceae bacterium]|jgi:hypothetical protein|nr:hypothetical protein [Streptococcaceae bacterium]